MRIEIDIADLSRVTNNLLSWARQSNSKNFIKSVDDVTANYKKLIRNGMTGEGDLMSLVEESTMDMPIRYGNPGSPIRKNVSSSRKPLVATGKAVDSIKKTRTNDGYEIAPSTEHGRLVFEYNAFKAKTKRDPLVTGEIQVAMLEAGLLKDLDEAIAR